VNCVFIMVQGMRYVMRPAYWV